MAVIHIHYAARSHNIEADVENMTDKEIKGEAARYLEITERDLSGFHVDRHKNGNATIRPDANFG